MAYSKTVWNNNTPPDISAENLNKMEQGIADAQFPDGGSTGQVLTKTATGQAWDDVDGLPAGGTAGQVLTKNSSTDGDASWQTSPSGGGGTWGYISGTLTDQTDLVAALDAKANTSTLATVESTSTASQAYSVGDYLVYNGILYKVISAINSGETLTPNTNIEATTTGAELTSLNKGLTNVQTGWFTTYPNGHMYNTKYFYLSIPYINVSQKTPTVLSAYVYSESGGFTDIKNDVSVDSVNKFVTMVRVTFNTAHVGRLLRIELSS